jgi:60 kDa SS-A/Ro ribonucleoprotein
MTWTRVKEAAMANAALFGSWVGRMLRRTDTVNAEGAPAFTLPPKHALAQYATTGCLNRTFYAGEAAQLGTVLELCGRVEASYLARTAVHAREAGAMKDLPALLCAVLATREGDWLARVFPRVVDSPRMLRTFVQIVRSGAVGRKSFGTRPKRLVRNWLATRSDDALFRASVGSRPSMADIVRMVHPRPVSPSRAALYGYLVGRPVDIDALPQVVREFERFKRDPKGEPPAAPLEMLAGLPLDPTQWAALARRATWQQSRLNLNTFARHGAFTVEGTTEVVASRLVDEDRLRDARAMPHQLMAARLNADADVPGVLKAALEEAMERSLSRVPRIEGRVVIGVDVSGSMRSPVTGHRRGATTTMRCVDVAALLTAAIVRRNPEATVIPFDERVVKVRVDPAASVLANASRLAEAGGGGTNCSAPVREAMRRGLDPDLVVLVSDNESWVDAGRGVGTALLREWESLRSRRPKARLICIDLQPNVTTQAYDREDVLNVGGFSDGVFEAVAEFARSGGSTGTWVERIERTTI